MQAQNATAKGGDSTGQDQESKSPMKFFLYAFAIPLVVVIAIVCAMNALD